MAILEATVPGLVGDSPELFAHAEQTLACALARDGDLAAAWPHRVRASTICATLGSVTAGRILDERWARAAAASAGSSAPPEPETSLDTQRATRRALHAMAAAIAHSSRASIVAHELLQLIGAAGTANAAHVTSHEGPENDIVTPAEGLAPALESNGERFIEVGKDNSDAIVGVQIEAKRGVDSVATINAVRILANAVQELVRARTEREERATLWPVDELPIEGDTSVISGHMREQMTYARRIATTKVNVLITGESGTGKEILARAIHTFSSRSHKPFVPFNCTAIPRDLLESQLFGHRRGAFTGADRDHLGLIRTAREGTLFLDEIGELGLDLQPKLLRFLESGEIAPLGEPTTHTVDVRIIAATNANLEDAVRAGRFREDLFYRLNVVRLSLRPLR